MPNAFLVLPEENRVILDSGETKHLRVTRAKPGDELKGIDGRGNVYRFVLEELGKSSASGTIIEREYVEKDGKSITVAVAATKWPRLHILIEKATELGVDRIELFNSLRSVSRVDESKLNKFNAVAREAAKQSVNPYIPEITVSQTLPLEGSYNLLLEFGGRPLLEVEEKLACERKLRLIVGPEGGFAPEEIKDISTRCTPVSLGRRTLRVETSVIVVLGIINYRLGRM